MGQIYPADGGARGELDRMPCSERKAGATPKTLSMIESVAPAEICDSNGAPWFSTQTGHVEWSISSSTEGDWASELEHSEAWVSV
ncbi:MAG: hypothetical protein O2991_02995, partial [Bacteroidetes bacterium]|nr:hypothetical protein [Bacteroidota bacterium]